jgi:hypothetical protein
LRNFHADQFLREIGWQDADLGQGREDVLVLPGQHHRLVGQDDAADVERGLDGDLKVVFRCVSIKVVLGKLLIRHGLEAAQNAQARPDLDEAFVDGRRIH